MATVLEGLLPMIVTRRLKRVLLRALTRRLSRTLIRLLLARAFYMEKYSVLL
jgi:hypothetical protein